jgi:disulfide bond formation protein DsbB
VGRHDNTIGRAWERMGPVSTETMSVFFASLSLVCWAATVAVVVTAALSRRAPEGSAARLLDDIRGVGLWAAWVVALVTTLGSLYYSQIANFVPCELCWFQRICMYPLAVILLVAALRDDRHVWTYVVPLTAVGAAIATYHTQLQAFPEQQTFCSTITPCTTRYVWEFGFVSLPFMSLAASCFIITMVLLSRATDPDRYEDDLDEIAVGDGGRNEDDPGAAAGASNLGPGSSVDAPPDQVGAV